MTEKQDAPAGPRPAIVDEVACGYGFQGAAVELGALVVDDISYADAPVRIPLAMINRHGLVAGATGTGKTKTLQLMAEQLSAAGVAVFAADIKGDLSGLGAPGEPSDRTAARAAAVGQSWVPAACAVELLTLGGLGSGTPIRVTMSSFGPVLLSKVLSLTEIQESSLGLVFHYADANGLPLLDLKDLRAVIQYLVSDDGKDDLVGLGGLSKSTAGVLLRELIGFADQGADVFFGEPEFETADLLRTTADGRGVVTLLELPQLQDRPALFSTFLLWMLADLFHDLPEIGDVDKPKLVFFFDEAHLLFHDASKAFLTSVAQTVRLIRSKGVGVFFVTQMPTDVPDDVLAQLGSRVQHQLRAHTPNDAKALRATVDTYPTSSYDLAQLFTQLGIGEAVVTVMDEDGAPTPVAWTRMRAPQSLMNPAPPDVVAATIAASPLNAKYAAAIDRDSAYEQITGRLAAGAAKAQAEADTAAAAKAAAEHAKTVATVEKQQQKAASDAAKQAAAADKRLRQEAAEAARRQRVDPGLADRIFADASRYKTMDGMARSAGRNIALSVVRGMFGIGRR